MLIKPFSVKCSPFFIILKHFSNNIKSETLAVIRGYLLKCFTIISNSLKDSTTKLANFLPFFLTFPTPKVFLISSNNAISLICNLIINEGATLHFVFNLGLGVIEIEKHDSASENPEINPGFSLVELALVLNDLIFNLVMLLCDNLFNCLVRALT
jgi:hypothetical protein